MPETFFGSSELQAALEGPGSVVITVGAVTAAGLVDRGVQALVEGQAGTAAGKVIQARVLTGRFSALAEGVAITVDGDSFKVIRQWQDEESDGAITLIWCGLP